VVVSVTKVVSSEFAELKSVVDVPMGVVEVGTSFVLLDVESLLVVVEGSSVVLLSTVVELSELVELDMLELESDELALLASMENGK